MLSGQIKVGDRVEISQKKEEAVDKSYISMVENKIGDNEVVLDVPISFGQLVSLRLGAGYSLLFFTEKGMYQFDASILSYYKEDGFNLMKAKLTSKGERVQRRDFFRYECFLPMKLSLLTEEEQKDYPKGSAKEAGKESVPTESYDGTIKDVSGGGLKFESYAEVREGNVVKCAFKLDGRVISAKGKILSKDKKDIENGKQRYLYRLQFIKISLDDQECIIKYIFMEQRRLLGRV